MALIKSKIAEFDLEITYWSADQINICWGNNINAHIQLFGYRSENHKKMQKERPVEVITFDFSDKNDFPFKKKGNNAKEFYNWLVEKLGKSNNEIQLEDKIKYLKGAISDEETLI